jgi:hypothetical protein
MFVQQKDEALFTDLYMNHTWTLKRKWRNYRPLSIEVPDKIALT